MKNIALLGFGTVGQGVYEILENRKPEIKALVGDDIRIKHILVHSKTKKRNVKDESVLTTDLEYIMNDDAVDVIVELTGTDEMAYQGMLRAMKSKKAVVTANKSVVSKYFHELHETAEKYHVPFLYEASVGGGIPIIKSLKEEVLFNDISSVEGILNGTCNYILTRMFAEDLSYQEVLKDAQDLGYAEADPTADVDGFDTMRKLRILSTIAFQQDISEQQIELTGISDVKKIDIQHFKEQGYTLKLIAQSTKQGDTFTATVEPTLIRKGDYFDFVNEAFNSVAFHGDHIGDLKFYGQGAGKLATGDAVLRDIIDILTDRATKNISSRDTLTLENENATHRARYYVRSDKPLSSNGTVQNGVYICELENTNRRLLEKELQRKEAREYFIAKIKE